MGVSHDQNIRHKLLRTFEKKEIVQEIKNILCYVPHNDSLPTSVTRLGREDNR